MRAPRFTSEPLCSLLRLHAIANVTPTDRQLLWWLNILNACLPVMIQSLTHLANICHWLTAVTDDTKDLFMSKSSDSERKPVITKQAALEDDDCRRCKSGYSYWQQTRVYVCHTAVNIHYVQKKLGLDVWSCDDGSRVMERFLIDFAGNGSVKRSELTQNNRIFWHSKIAKIYKHAYV